MRAPAFVRVPFVLTVKCQVLVSSDAYNLFVDYNLREIRISPSTAGPLNSFVYLIITIITWYSNLT